MVLRSARRDAGLTLLEVLFAMALLSLGLLAVGTAFPAALSGVEFGRQQTTAIFLAEERLEQVKNATFANVTAASFPAEAYGSITDHAGFRREAAITNNPGGAGTDRTLVQVRVFYRPLVSWGILTTERQVQVSTMVWDR